MKCGLAYEIRAFMARSGPGVAAAQQRRQKQQWQQGQGEVPSVSNWQLNC
jgi:hypothetical protein